MVAPHQISQHSVPNATMVMPFPPQNGGSQPRFCDFDDMVLRLVKWQPSSHGLTASYSELVVSRIAQLIEAPVIRGTIVYVDLALLPPGVGDHLTQPFHVGFTYAPGQNFSESDYAGIENNVALPAAAVHLAWLQIGDQRSHNQYLYQPVQVLPDKSTRKMNHFILIDQAKLCGTFDWSSLSLGNPNAPYDLPPHMKTRISMDAVEPVIERLRVIDENSIRACFYHYPESWNLELDIAEKMADYLLLRREHLEQVLSANLPN